MRYHPIEGVGADVGVGEGIGSGAAALLFSSMPELSHALATFS